MPLVCFRTGISTPEFYQDRTKQIRSSLAFFQKVNNWPEKGLKGKLRKKEKFDNSTEA